MTQHFSKLGNTQAGQPQHSHEDYLFQHLLTEPFLLLANATFFLAQASQAAVPCYGGFFAAATLVPTTPHGWSLQVAAFRPIA